MVKFTPLHQETIGTLIVPDTVVDIGESHGERFDGAYCGIGFFRQTKIIYVIQDYTFLGGSFGIVQNEQITTAIETAIQEYCPILFYFSTGGARIQQGSESIYLSALTLQALCKASGYIPTIAVVNGICAGLGAYLTATCDFAIFIKDSSRLFMTGPKVIHSAIGKTVSQEKLGGTNVHAHTTGTATHVVNSLKEAQQTITCLLTLIPSDIKSPKRHAFKVASKDDKKKFSHLLPADNKATYDMFRVIEQIVDSETLNLLYADFAPNLITGLASFQGMTIGIIANQPKVLSGCLEVKSADKLSRFLQICDAYNIPLLFLVDCPGFMPGEQQEHAGLVNSGARATQVLASCICPRISVVLRRMTGGSYPVMNSKSFGADHTIVWENAEIAIMSMLAAGKVNKREQEAAESPAILLKKGLIDEVIAPDDTYTAIAKAFAKVLAQPPKELLSKRRVILPI